MFCSYSISFFDNNQYFVFEYYCNSALYILCIKNDF